jgi:hypothetical protein
MNDLEDALDLALAGGFRVTEADIRVGLAWGYFKADEPERARLEAQRALQMSVEMGYFWGERDAEKALAEIGPWEPLEQLQLEAGGGKRGHH